MEGWLGWDSHVEAEFVLFEAVWDLLVLVVVDFRSDGKGRERGEDVFCHDPLEIVGLMEEDTVIAEWENISRSGRMTIYIYVTRGCFWFITFVVPRAPDIRELLNKTYHLLSLISADSNLPEPEAYPPRELERVTAWRTAWLTAWWKMRTGMVSVLAIQISSSSLRPWLQTLSFSDRGSVHSSHSPAVATEPVEFPLPFPVRVVKYEWSSAGHQSPLDLSSRSEVAAVRGQREKVSFPSHCWCRCYFYCQGSPVVESVMLNLPDDR